MWMGLGGRREVVDLAEAGLLERMTYLRHTRLLELALDLLCSLG